MVVKSKYPIHGVWIKKKTFFTIYKQRVVKSMSSQYTLAH